MDLEDAIRSTISICGGGDTIAAVAGAGAGAYHGVSDEMRKKAISYMDEGMKEILFAFEARFLI